MSERQILITIDQPHWDEGDWEYLRGRVEYAVSTEVPSDHYTIQEFTK